MQRHEIVRERARIVPAERVKQAAVTRGDDFAPHHFTIHELARRARAVRRTPVTLQIARDLDVAFVRLAPRQRSAQIRQSARGGVQQPIRDIVGFRETFAAREK